MRLLQLAVRNLFRNARRTAITVAAIASGLALVLMMVSMQAGQYADMLRIGISTMAGHVVVQADGWQEEREAEQLLHDADAVTAALSDAFPEATVTPRLYLGGLLTSPRSSAGVALRGGVPSAEATVDTLDDKLVAGDWLADDDGSGVVLGAGLAEALSVEVGDKVVYMGQTSEQEEMVSRMLRVRGLFRTGGAELDGMVALVTLDTARQLVEHDDVAHQVALHLSDPAQSPEAVVRARQLVSADGRDVLEWPEALPGLVNFIEIDRVSGDVMMSIMGLIVAMGVLNTVLMSVLERTKEFGVLLAIGMTPRRLGALVLLESALLGVLGAAVGACFGAAIVWYLVAYGIDYSAYMGEAFEMEGLVMSTLIRGAWDPDRMGAYLLATVVFTFLAGLWPAWHLTRLQPVDAMRAP
jgi:ABC-type lipoprotein release transport system permease subunit